VVALASLECHGRLGGGDVPAADHTARHGGTGAERRVNWGAVLDLRDDPIDRRDRSGRAWTARRRLRMRRGRRGERRVAAPGDDAGQRRGRPHPAERLGELREGRTIIGRRRRVDVQVVKHMPVDVAARCPRLQAPPGDRLVVGARLTARLAMDDQATVRVDREGLAEGVDGAHLRAQPLERGGIAIPEPEAGPVPRECESPEVAGEPQDERGRGPAVVVGRPPSARQDLDRRFPAPDPPRLRRDGSRHVSGASARTTGLHSRHVTSHHRRQPCQPGAPRPGLRHLDKANAARPTVPMPTIPRKEVPARGRAHLAHGER